MLARRPATQQEAAATATSSSQQEEKNIPGVRVQHENIILEGSEGYALGVGLSS